MSDCEREHCVLALLLLLLVFDSCHAERSVGGDGVGPPMIQQKYMVIWTEVATGPFSVWVDNNDDLKSIACSSNDNCTAALYGLDVALSYDTSLPSEPYCRFAHSEHQDHQDGLGYCTCGPEKCVSYSREYNNNGEPFYYCGPCGWVGSECYNTTCTHPLAECINDYCECLNYGLFYDLSYCYIPFYGKELVAVMLITTIIVVILCTFLAYGYHRLRNRSRRGFPESWFRGNVTRQAPANDTPPTYDDVVEKLPSYQDALQMVIKENGDGGLSNAAFEAEREPPSYDESEQVTPAVTLTSTPTCAPASTPESTASSTPIYLPTSTSIFVAEEQETTLGPETSPPPLAKNM